MAKPILYDLVIAQKINSLAPHHKGRSPNDILLNVELADQIRSAVPFVIDDDTVRMAQVLRNTFISQDKYCLPDACAVPFGTTWIEYNPRAKTNAGEIYPDTATAFGHMIFAYPDGVTVMTVEAFKRDIYIAPYTFNWTWEGMTAPVRMNLGTHQKILKDPSFFRRTLLLGQPHGRLGKIPDPDWIERFGGDTFQYRHDKRELNETMNNAMQELLIQHAGTASLLMGILAIMAHVPNKQTKVAPSGRWVAPGMQGSKPFHRHTVVRIETGERQVYQSVTNALKEQIRRAQHDVREHWRVYRRGRPDEYRVKISSHKRGDPAIGIITHSHYETVRVHRERSK